MNIDTEWDGGGEEQGRRQEPGKLTRRQMELLERIGQCWAREEPPTLAALARQLGLAGESGVRMILKYLVRDGFVTTEGKRGAHTHIKLTDRGKAAVGFSGGFAAIGLAGTPLVGMATAGLPGGYALDATRLVQCSEHPQGRDYCYAEIRGDSMDLVGVEDGDMVLLHREPARTGQIVAAQLAWPDGHWEFTLKRLERYSKTTLVQLTPQSSNPAHQPIVLAPEPLPDEDVVSLAPESALIEWVWHGALIRTGKI
jgi:SOS-response transcriptional repressor LexA